ncbi:hypothetical protein KR215_007694 [Drosophila sulfurigaster]|nr:hypothetical protein KR215_007694 [Drosophila sulfurigaster]
MSLTKKDPSLRVAASDPHLVSLGGGRLSTAVTIHYIHIGDTTIGSAPSCSISLNGSGVRPLHCTIYRSDSNEVTIVPEPEARLLIDGAHIEGEEVKLSQGAMITIGNSNYLRFNNPDEAQMMRSAMGSNERISMPHIDFTQQSTQSQSRHEARERELESFYESIINPFKHNEAAPEMNMHGVQCPKVFSSDLVTVNMPARDVLGQKYASFARNLAENHRSDKQLNNQYAKNQLPGGSNVNGIGHNAGYCNVPSNAAIFKQQQQHQQQQAQAQHPQSQSVPAAELLTKVNNVGYDRYPKPGTYTAGGLQIYAMNGINTELNSGVELEDMLKICTEYADRQQEQQRERERDRDRELNSSSNHGMHNASSGNANGSSITSSPIVQNRIKTNGSLPRDKKSPFQQLASAGGSSSNLALVSSTSGYENVRLLGPNRVEINGQLHVSSSAASASVSSSTAAAAVATATVGNGATNSNHESGTSGGGGGGKYVPQSPRTKIRTNCMSPKKDVSFGNAFAASQQSTPVAAVVKPPLAPKPPPPNQQRDYEQLFKSFERKQQLEQQEQRQVQVQLTPAKRTNKNINNLTLKLNESETMHQASPKPSRKPAPAPRSINAEQRQRRELLQRRKQLKRELAELPPNTEHIEVEPSDHQSLTSRPSTPRQQLQALQNRIHRLEAQRNATRVMEENQQAKLKQSIEMKQDQLNKLRAMLKQKPNNACLKEELEHVCESLDSDRKNFEDLEFQYFEEESEHHACHEELKRQEQRLTLESELASLGIQLGPDEPGEESTTAATTTATTTPSHSGRSSPVANGNNSSESSSSNLVNGVMSQSLFGSAELLCPKRRNDDDLMSKSVNENMFYNNNKIELPHGGDHNKVTTSTPKRPPLQIYDAGSCEQISFNLSLRSDRFEVNPLERRVPSQDDIDRSCKVANDAPISTSQGASTKIFDSIKEIERNRKLLLAQQGHQVIEHERQKIYDLKKKSHDEARTQYLRSTQQTTTEAPQSPQLPHAPLNANGGKDAKLFEKTELQKLNEKETINASADGSPLTTITKTTTTNAGQQQQRHSQPELEHHGIVGVVAPTARSPRPLSEANNCDASIEAPKFANDSTSTAAQQQQQQGENNKRASSNSNSQDTASAGSGSGSGGSSSGAGTGSSSTASVNAVNANGERKRALAKHQRPLTRYLPIFSPDLNLRHHIETAGHQIDLCPHVFVDAQSCRGYLHKLGATFHAWSRRWFVLDRQRSALIYYSDKSERKPRGGAYFSTIDEVYLDHLNASKSGRPHCTFIVKTKKRSYNLQAASDAAARIWIDAIITGAQGNLDY